MAENFEVAAYLKAYDQSSSVVKKVALSFDVLKKHGVSAFDTLMEEAKVYENAMKKAADSSESAFKKSMKSGMGHAIDGLKSAVVGGAAAIGAAAAGGVALGFKTLNDIEGFKIQFETAFKGDTKKAQEHMKWALGFAKETPFSSNEVVNVATKLEMRGLDAEKNLSQLGDFASAYDKSLDQTAEAFFDAQTGEWERLKDFGFKKEDLEKNFKKLGFTDIFDAKGSIKDAGKFRTAFFKMLEANYSGAMEKKSKTFGAQLETLKDNVSLTMAELFGGVENVREGSLFDVAKKQLMSLNEWFEKTDTKAMIDRWTKNIDKFVGDASEDIKEFLDDISKSEVNFDWEEAKTMAIQLKDAILGIGSAVIELGKFLASIDLTTLKYISAAVVGAQVGGVYGAGVAVLAMAGMDVIAQMKKNEGPGNQNSLGFNYNDAIIDQYSVKGKEEALNNLAEKSSAVNSYKTRENNFADINQDETLNNSVVNSFTDVNQDEILNNMPENNLITNNSNVANTNNTTNNNNYNNGYSGAPIINFSGPVTVNNKDEFFSKILNKADAMVATLN